MILLISIFHKNKLYNIVYIMNNIPKIFFTYWDGSILSQLQYLTIISFKELNPDWRIIVYMPLIRYEPKTWKTVNQKIKYNGEDYLDKMYQIKDIEIIKIDFEQIGFKNNVSEVFKSDYLRYYFLDKHGGLWSDMDILYIKPIDILFEKINNNIDTILSYFDKYYSIGLLISQPNNDFFKLLCNSCNNHFNPNEYQSIGSYMIKKIYPIPDSSNIFIMDKFYYLPYNFKSIDQIFNKSVLNNIKNYTLGIHWFNGDNKTKQYQNIKNIPKTASIYPFIKKYL